MNNVTKTVHLDQQEDGTYIVRDGAGLASDIIVDIHCRNNTTWAARKVDRLGADKLGKLAYINWLDGEISPVRYR